jgi:glycosyltransferase involved in cell wall biosynthesis
VSRVSVVVPTYNRAELLRLTLQSVLNQTVAPHEVIVVDDGSTDHTVQVCADFGDSIRYLRQENQRLPTARNTGIRAACSDWIALCDSDDLWRPRKLEVQLSSDSFRNVFPVFQQTDIAPEKHFRRWLDESEIQVGSDRIPVYSGDAFGMLFEGNIALPSTSMISRTLLEKSGLFDTTFRAEETEFFHRIAAYATVAIVMEPLTDYRVGHASLIGGEATPFIQDALRSVELAAVLRPKLTAAELAAFKDGQRQLRMRLAYARLSSLDRAGAREALSEAWSEGRMFSARSATIMIASFLPEAVLRGLHRAKRTIRRQTK